MSQSLSLIDSLSALRDDLGNGDALARLKALELSRKLQAELEVPGETLIKTMWAEDLDIFKIMSEDNDSPKTAAQIAEKAKAEPFLIAMNSVDEVGPDTFAANKFSRYLLTESADATMSLMRWFQQVEQKAPEYFSEHKYKSPSDIKKSPFAWAYDLGDISWFEFMAKEPRIGLLFAKAMQAQGEGKPSWCSDRVYPAKEQLKSVDDPDGALIVDVGGGSGHDMQWFRNEHPELKGRLIVQDLPYLTDSLKLEGIEVMAHDFYEAQPVKGAQVYFMHHIIHDYDDETCVKILQAIVPAMKPGYSKLLIHDLVLPDQGAHWFTTTMDLLMMLCMSARERTRAQFIELVNQVGGGLRVEKVWIPKGVGMMDSVVECVIDP